MNYDVNKCSEYAMKDSEGNELSKVNTAESIPVLTLENINKIYKEKPRVIKYDGSIFYLSNSDDILDYFTTIFDDYTCNYISFNGTSILSKGTLMIASQEDIPTETGTKLYKHLVRNGAGTIEYISTSGSAKSVSNILRITSVNPSGTFTYDGIDATAYIVSYGPTFISYIDKTDGTYKSNVNISTFWDGANDTVTPL